MRNLGWVCIPLLFASACGGKAKPAPPPPPPPVEKPKPPPPPPPVCVQAGAAQSLVGMVEADDKGVKFCVSDGDSNKCYGVDLAAKKYSVLDTPPTGQPAALDPDPAKIETTATEVKVCVGSDCKTIKPKMPKGNQNEINAVVNANGTTVAVSMGNSDMGKGTVDVWDVQKGKKLATIKYAKGDYKCGETAVLGNTVYVSASVCSGPSARGWLFNLKGKKVADVGGKEFGTYGAPPVQVDDTKWAFLEETGATIAIQDVATGKLDKTIDIGSLWAGDANASGADGGAPPAMGNAGESALARGGDGKLVVVTGGPAPGSVGVIDVAGGTLADTVPAIACEEKEAAPAAGAGDGSDDGDGAGSDDGDGGDSTDDSGGDQ